MKNILICVCGGIASYKSPNMVSSFIKKGYSVEVVMSASAKEFISPTVFEALSGNKVHSDLFSDPMAHINLGKTADFIIVIPATYNIIGKIASGIADDLMTSIIAAYDKDVFFALAMNDKMYTNEIFNKNIAYLKSVNKYHFIEADEGFLACNEMGIGRLKDTQEIVDFLLDYFNNPKALILSGKKVIITAGKTKEYMDPIRYISNDSSGKLGVHMASCAKSLGAEVTLIIGENNLPIIHGINTINVVSAEDMYREALLHYSQADIIICAAAVSDYKFKTISPNKLKKSTHNIIVEMEKNIDIAMQLGKLKKHRVLVGFALESENIEHNAMHKLHSKNLDLIIANYPDNIAKDSGKFYLINKQGLQEVLECTKKQFSNILFTRLEYLINKS